MENTSLVRQLMDSAELSEEQAARSLTIIASYAIEKFPILEGTINSYIRQEFKSLDHNIRASLDN